MCASLSNTATQCIPPFKCPKWTYSVRTTGACGQKGARRQGGVRVGVLIPPPCRKHDHSIPRLPGNLSVSSARTGAAVAAVEGDGLPVLITHNPTQGGACDSIH